MKASKASAAALAALLVITTFVPSAIAQDYIPQGPSLNGTGKVAFLIQDDRPMTFKWIAKDAPEESRKALGNQWCHSYTSESCRLEKGVTLRVAANLGMCQGDDFACVEKVKIYRDGEPAVDAEFLRETTSTPLPENDFGAPRGGGTTIWRAPGILSDTGLETYAVSVHLGFVIEDGKRISYTGVSSAVAPVSEISDPRYHPGKILPFLREGVTWWAHDNGSVPGYDCFATDWGKCWMRANFSDGTRVELQLRLPVAVSGWLHGRLDKTELSIDSINSKANRVVVVANPVEVPIMYAVVDEKQSNPRIQRILEMSTSGGGWNGGIGGLEWKLYETDWDQTRELVSHFADSVNDQAVATQNVWSFKSIPSDTGNKCLDQKGRLIGLVTTNAMAYEAGPPRFRNGFLNYSTAGLHKLPTGDLAFGSYNLIIRSETARCLYRFSNAPVSATITVSGQADRDVATTIVSEKNGWLKLAASGFTFSQKTIRIKLSQKRTTITCVSVANPMKTRKVTAIGPKCPSGFKKK